MTYKNFKILKIVVTSFLAMIVAQAVIFSNYILAATALVSALAIIFVSRKKVSEIISDERDLEIAGKSARLSLSIFSVITAIATFVFMSQRNANPAFLIISSTLAYSVCGLLLLYSFLFKYYEKQN